MASYDPNNVFAKILRGELPAYKVYEDEKSFAFLDIMPRAPGHALVLPKAAARNILDVEPDDLAHVMKVTQKIANFHLHVHVIPRRAGIALKPPASEKEKPEVLAEHAERLAKALAAG